MFLKWLLECFYCFIISVGFCVIFNVKGKDVFYGGFGSALGCFLYLICQSRFGSIVGGYFIATVATTLYSEYMAVNRKKPSTIFLIPSIIPFVPGGIVFRAMSAWLNGDQNELLVQGRYSITVAGAIALGIIIGISFVRLQKSSIKLLRSKF
ncbi:threonine/serine exporter family protein [[Clostridium] polysaccharolyticum]|uniref:Uncharacterized membrane protein YjjB, DUF3815 family n=1 Tax=[Clostridium] polysaccharolyticum TaxID=29364 RepID=A0A1I0CYY1_9FIRM|nr:threonine/serine exporter family protein [[Clostridium] polysaccharolyticum]SET25077.1 Uncharacterized membrane protein YjjB, DUF3815 family [[Clostridium] polysaccharolyticum]